MSVKIEITKAKILNGPKVEIDYIKTDDQGRVSEHEDRYKNEPHPDFRKAFAALAPHAALLAEFIDEGEIKNIKTPDTEKFSAFAITGFTIGGSDEKEGVILTGQKTLRTGKKMSFNTPQTNLNAEGEGAYVFIDDLWEKLREAKKQASLYLGGYYAVDPQLPLDFSDGGKSKTVVKVLPPISTEEKIRQAIETGGTEEYPLSDFQDISKTGRKDERGPVDPGQDKKDLEKGKTKTGRKKVAQSPDHPSGEA